MNPNQTDFTEENWDRLIENCDSNGDGIIQFDEFKDNLMAHLLHDAHAVPDDELLTFQRQRTMPSVQITEVDYEDEGDIVHAEIDDFETADIDDAHMGLARAGSEEHVVK